MDVDELIIKRLNVQDTNGPPYVSADCTRDDLAKFMGELGYKTGAEIGVMTGKYSELLCYRIPGLHIKCIDPWLPFRRNRRNIMEDRYTRACRRLSKFQAEIIREKSMDTVRNIPDKSLDFVYIDEMHEFDPVMMDLICWSDKIRVGGIVAGHDYVEPSWCNGVKLAVNTYTKAHGITKWYVTSEPERSFFWIKK